MSSRPPVLAVVLGVPALVTAVTVVTTAALAGGAPARVAVHWGVSGAPDGFAAPGTVVALSAVIGIAVTALAAVVLIGSRAEVRRIGLGHKVVAAAVTGAVAVLGGLEIWTLAAQQGAAVPPSAAPGVGIGLLAGLAVGALVWFLLPRASRLRDAPPAPGTPLELGADERVAWIGTARISRVAAVVLGALLVVVLGITAWAILATDGRAWPVLLIPVVFALLMLAFLRFTVRVDAAGLTVRGVLGLPVWRIAPAAIAVAGVVEVAPLADFGGWGVRIGRHRRTGIVTRPGEALEVRRRSGRALVVTVDDASTAAGLLTALAARSAR